MKEKAKKKMFASIPWQAVELNGSVMITCADGDIVEINTGDHGYGVEGDKVIAAFIVQAVNSHDELVEAARSACSLLESIGNGQWIWAPAGERLRAALARATEGDKR